MNSIRIIVVDDDDAIRSVIVALAQETVPSAVVIPRASSRRVMQDMSSGSVDLLITNCHMPDMDGPTLIKTLRRDKYVVPIIMVSGSEEAREFAEEVGVDRFISKSALTSELPEAIKCLLPTA